LAFAVEDLDVVAVDDGDFEDDDFEDGAALPVPFVARLRFADAFALAGPFVVVAPGSGSSAVGDAGLA